jgi:hypothetical protein
MIQLMPQLKSSWLTSLSISAMGSISWFHYAGPNWRPILTTAPRSFLEIGAARLSVSLRSMGMDSGSASVVSRRGAFSGGPHPTHTHPFIRFRLISSPFCSITDCLTAPPFFLPGMNCLNTFKPQVRPDPLLFPRPCNSRAGTLWDFHSPQPIFSALTPNN